MPRLSAKRLSQAVLAEIYADIEEALASFRASHPPVDPHAPNPCLPAGGHDKDNAWQQQHDFLRHARQCAWEDREKAKKEAARVKRNAEARAKRAAKKAAANSGLFV